MRMEGIHSEWNGMFTHVCRHTRSYERHPQADMRIWRHSERRAIRLPHRMRHGRRDTSRTPQGWLLAPEGKEAKDEFTRQPPRLLKWGSLVMDQAARMDNARDLARHRKSVWISFNAETVDLVTSAFECIYWQWSRTRMCGHQPRSNQRQSLEKGRWSC